MRLNLHTYLYFTEHKIQRDDLMNPYWIEDKDLRKAEVDFLTQKEASFRILQFNYKFLLIHSHTIQMEYNN